jgi:uncharacterized protein with HEPN domain
MPLRDWRFRIRDILDAIESIRSYTEGMDFVTFENDKRTVDAVVRNLIIIGEAATRVPEESVRSFPDVPWAEMRAMRNLVVHEYFGVSNRIIWDTVQGNLRPLAALLQTILDSMPGTTNP